MLRNSNQWPGIKIEVARGKNTSKCYKALREICGNNLLQNRTVALCLKEFRAGWIETSNLPHTGRSSIPQLQIYIVSGILSIGRRWAVRELSVKCGLRHQCNAY